jgi:hypothetical protein
LITPYGDFPRLELQIASGAALDHCRMACERYHYLRTFPDPRTQPLTYVLRMCGRPVGCLVFGRPESTRCYRGGLTYGTLADRASGRAVYDRWEILNLSRVWLDPSVQDGGRYAATRSIPGFRDRHGDWRPAMGSALITHALGRIGFDYLMARPPCFVEEPYEIRAVLSYCDTRIHRGRLYHHSGFKLARRNAVGVETWWIGGLPPLTWGQDENVRLASETHPRSVRIRAAAAATKGGAL